jgi:hypothetical protein
MKNKFSLQIKIHTIFFVFSSFFMFKGFSQTTNTGYIAGIGGSFTVHSSVPLCTFLSGTGIQIIAPSNLPYHVWSVSNATYTSPSFQGTLPSCIYVPYSPNPYKVSNTYTSGGITKTEYCYISILPPTSFIHQPTIFQVGKPSDPIVKTINTDMPVGTIKGTNEVSLTGAATYSIPIALPSGTAGVEPSLAIGYNSSSGNGLIGYGWNMSIGSSITRVQTDLYNDDQVSSPTLSIDDAYALDGNRLILMSGVYGNDGSTYQTKNESFSRITLKKNDAGVKGFYFIVDTKDGKQIEYGISNNSRIYKDENIVVWQINKVKDLNENYMEYLYSGFGNFSLLSEIRYTGNTKPVVGFAPYNIVKFRYSKRGTSKNWENYCEKFLS